MVDMLCRIDDQLKKYVIHTASDHNIMYGKLNNVIYRTWLKAILFYIKLATQLHQWGYIMNPYDTFIWNKMVNGKQITV